MNRFYALRPSSTVIITITSLIKVKQHRSFFNKQTQTATDILIFLYTIISNIMASSFGSWYEQQQRAENGGGEVESTTSSSWFSIDSEQVLPLFNSDSLQGFSFESMRQSMEAQMPKKVLGMGYQQRFKVSMIGCFFVLCAKRCLFL
jgi:hypothetical protein